MEVDPVSGQVLDEILRLDQNEVWGLAGFGPLIFAFDCSGDIVLINPQTGTTEVIAETNKCWYGAGVRTVPI